MRRDAAGAVLVSAAVVAISLILLAYDPQFFFRDDFQTQHLPATLDIARAIDAGELPLLSLSSWTAAPLAGEFQYGVFSIFITLCNVVVWKLGLTIAGVAAALSIVHLVVTAAGCYLLARSYQLPPTLAALVALIGTFNGFLFLWGALNWYPVLTSFAWIPWFWLGMERRSIVLTGVSLYLVIAAGWPFTILMAALIAAAYVLPDLYARRWRDVAAAAAAGAIGFALSAAPLLALLEHVGATNRSRMPSGGDIGWLVPPFGYIGMILPVFRATWMEFYLEKQRQSVELAGALVPFVAVLVAAFTLRKKFFLDNARVLIIAGGAMFLASQESYGMFRFSFRWLALFHLALAIAGARALASVPKNVGKYAAALVAAVFALALIPSEQRTNVLIVGSLTLLATIVWAVTKHHAAAIGVALVSLFAHYPLMHRAEIVPFWRFDDAQMRRNAPFDPAGRYINMFAWYDLLDRNTLFAQDTPANPLFRPGNLSMLSDVEIMGGYTPMGLLGLHEAFFFGIHGYIQDFMIERILRDETKPGARFDHFAIDGFVVSTKTLGKMKIDGFPGWKRVAAYDGLELYERERPMRTDVQLAPSTLMRDVETQAAIQLRKRKTQAAPWVLTGAGRNEHAQRERCTTAVLSDVRVTRFASRATIDTTSCRQNAVVVFMRPALPGFVAKVAGEQVPLLKADVVMPAVEVKPGVRGEVAVEYRPRSLRVGLLIGALGVAGIVAALLVGLIRRKAP